MAYHNSNIKYLVPVLEVCTLATGLVGDHLTFQEGEGGRGGGGEGGRLKNLDSTRIFPPDKQGLNGPNCLKECAVKPWLKLTSGAV